MGLVATPTSKGLRVNDSMLDTVTSDQIEYAFDPTGKVFLLLLLPLTIQRSLPFSVDLRQVYVEWSGALECWLWIQGLPDDCALCSSCLLSHLH